MAAGLPVVTARIPPLDTVIRAGQEGALFTAGDVGDLARAMRSVAEAPERAAMGQRARDRVVEHYSWARHCAELETLLRAISGERQ